MKHYLLCALTMLSVTSHTAASNKSSLFLAAETLCRSVVVDSKLQLTWKMKKYLAAQDTNNQMTLSGDGTAILTCNKDGIVKFQNDYKQLEDNDIEFEFSSKDGTTTFRHNNYMQPLTSRSLDS